LERLLQNWSRAHQKTQASAERKRTARQEGQEKESWGCRLPGVEKGIGQTNINWQPIRPNKTQ